MIPAADESNGRGDPPDSTTDVRVTSSMEDYLKAAYHLEQAGGAVTNQRMADELGLSQPSVTNMVKRLNDLNLVVHSPYKGLELTQAGRTIALEVIRHHRLLELYLMEALGYTLEEVHAEAERLEHHISEEMEERMARALGFPQFDPHGDPIPARDGRLPDMEDVELVDLVPGDSGVISRVSDRDPERLSYLFERGFRPGLDISVLETMPFEGPVRVNLDGFSHLLPYSVAQLIRVERSGSETETIS